MRNGKAFPFTRNTKVAGREQLADDLRRQFSSGEDSDSILFRANDSYSRLAAFERISILRENGACDLLA